MNTLDFLRDKTDRIGARLPKSGITAIVRHIEIAERHFERGRESGDTDLFTDVVYRTNHAFEGILRESFAILAGKDPATERPYDIENYLTENKVFQPRVMELFANYRTKWRNPSTHDHVVTFTESEAFLSILNVTAFVGILMDQMIEKLTFEQEKVRLYSVVETLKRELARHQAEPFVDRITYLLQTFASNVALAHSGPSETEMMAALRAFLESVAPGIAVDQEPLIKDDMGTLRPDFIMQDGKERVVLEMKRYRKWDERVRRAATDQVQRHLQATGIESAVLFVYPTADAERGDETHDKTLVENLDSDRILVTIRLLPKADG